MAAHILRLSWIIIFIVNRREVKKSMTYSEIIRIYIRLNAKETSMYGRVAHAKEERLESKESKHVS